MARRRYYRRRRVPRAVTEGRNYIIGQNAIGTDQSKSYWGTTYKVAKDMYKAGGDPAPYYRRRAYRFYGPGDYRSWAKYIPRGIGALGAGMAGYLSGGLSGASAGLRSGWESGGNFSKNVLGWGDYSTNQIMDASGGQSSQQQLSVNRTDLSGDVYLERTEFIRNITVSAPAAGATSFQINVFPINPGLSSSFPVGSQIAQNFELYDFEGLIYSFKPTFSENSGSANNLGKVIMATNYDPTAAPFFSSVQMENYDYANSTKPSCACVHGVETDNSQQHANMYYIRSGDSSKDLTTTDLGNFYIATEGIPVTSAVPEIIGELWVTYKLKLSRMQIFGSQLLLNALYSNATITSSAAAAVVSVAQGSQSNFELTYTNNGANSFFIDFPTDISLGTYHFDITANSGGTAFAASQTIACAVVQNCTLYLMQAGISVGLTTGTTTRGSVYLEAVVNAPGVTQGRFRVDLNQPCTATTTITVRAYQISTNAATTVVV